MPVVHNKRSFPLEAPPPPTLRNESTLDSLFRTVSPPPIPKRRKNQVSSKSVAAAIEAGEKHVSDHLAFYSSHLLSAIRPSPNIPHVPRLSHAAWIELYRRNAGSLKGCHYVIHQHDHPVAGTHYDLRLQCNPTSSISFAIMYGLPGNPNSRRPNRNAMETRVHCLWNHLIETASWSTGSMLLWDTGEYEVLPYEKDEKMVDNVTDSEDDDGNDEEVRQQRDVETQQQKLKHAFRRRKIRLRLHGTKLPKGYTLSLRLTKGNFRSVQPKAPSRRRKRTMPKQGKLRRSETDSGSDNKDEHPPLKRNLSSLSRLESPPPSPSEKRPSLTPQTEDATAIASDNEEEVVREHNAYIGAMNDVGSIHQRRWYLSMDRVASGFVKKTLQSHAGFTNTVWQRRDNSTYGEQDVSVPTGFERFIVGGRDTERSVLTGRLAGDILADEGVIGYIPRGLWRPVTE